MRALLSDHCSRLSELRVSSIVLLLHVSRQVCMNELQCFLIVQRLASRAVMS